MPTKTTKTDAATLGNSTHLHGHEIRWNGPNGEVVVYGDDGEPVRCWSERENKDGKALGEAIKWARYGPQPQQPLKPKD